MSAGADRAASAGAAVGEPAADVGAGGYGAAAGAGSSGSAHEAAGRVRLGIEALLAAGPGGRTRIGLLSNQAAILPDGRATWQALRDAGFPLVRLFGPEHGFKVDTPDAVQVRDETLFNLETVSLYGERRRPAREQVEDLDAVVCDIQDVGCRYYTYVYTMAGVMEACAEAGPATGTRATGTEVIVCDRPNPIGADTVEGGPIPDAAANEVGGYRLAQRHGMTLGELASYIMRNYLPDTPLSVAWMERYRRHLHYRECGVPWKQPSPNLPSPETALAYPGTCLFEGTNISEGRGTTRPFETIGAPWLDAEQLREELAARELPGVVFSVSDFTPSFSTFAGEACRGVQLHVTDRERFRPLLTGAHLLHAVRGQAPARFGWRPLWQDESRSFVDWLAGTEELRRAIDGGAEPDAAYEILCRDGNTFLEARKDALHYE